MRWGVVSFVFFLNRKRESEGARGDGGQEWAFSIKGVRGGDGGKVDDKYAEMKKTDERQAGTSRGRKGGWGSLADGEPC